MKNFFKKPFTAVVLTVVLLISISSCKKHFDAPPGYVAPSITANTSIRALKQLHTSGGSINQINTDLIIRGIVIADDRSGNFYKSIVIQDETGGILIRLEGNSLYTTYPIGQEVFIKCNGLYLGDYNNLIQMGGGVDNTVTPASLLTLPSALFGQYIIKGTAGNIVAPKVVTVGQLSTNMQDTLQNTLIQLNNYEFAAADTGKTYANASTTPPGTVNFTIKGCSGGTIILRNSGYASFAGINVPNGNGNIVSVYGVFGNTKQLTIRDTSDVQFYGTRCGGSGGGGGGGGGGTPTLISLATLRSLYTGSDIKFSSNYLIAGVVISDAANKNINKNTVIIQDGNTGMSVYFGTGATVAYNIGDSIVIDISGDSLLKFRGSLQVKSNPGLTSLPAPVAVGRMVTPNTVTISQLNSAMSQPLGTAGHIENTLLKIVNATASGSGSPVTYGGNKTLTDATGNLVLRTSTTASGPATFAATALPTGPKTWTGYCNFFNMTPQFQIRNPTLDVQ